MTTSRSARTKQIRLDAEQLIQQSAMKWTILRPTMIHGVPGDRNLSRLLTPLRRVPVLPVPGGGQHIQQPVHVHVADLAEAVLAAAERPAATGTSYDVAGPAPLSVRRPAADLRPPAAEPGRWALLPGEKSNPSEAGTAMATSWWRPSAMPRPGLA